MRVKFNDDTSVIITLPDTEAMYTFDRHEVEVLGTRKYLVRILDADRKCIDGYLLSRSRVERFEIVPAEKRFSRAKYVPSK